MRTMNRQVTRLALALLLIGVGAECAHGQDWRTVTMSRQIEDGQAAAVEVRYGAGQLSVGPAETGILYRMQLRYDEKVFEPVAERRGSTLRLGAESIGRSFRIGRNRTGGEMELELARDIAMDLSMEFGAVKANIDLGGLRLTGLDIETGASQTQLVVSEPNPEIMDEASLEVGAAEFTARQLGNLNASRIEVDAGLGDIDLYFTGEWQRDARVSVDMGLGALTLRFPKGLGVRLVKDTFLTSLDSEGLVKRGDAYYSLDYDEADYQVTVDVDAAFGSIRVLWVR